MTTTLEQAAASLVLKLASTPSQQVINHAVTGRAKLAAAMEPLFATAQERWRLAALESARHVALVVGNNPGKELDEVLARPDVQQALRDNWRRAADEVRTGIIGAWGEGVRLGAAQAKADLRTLGVPVTDEPAPLEVGKKMLTRLLADATDNAEAAGERMVAAVFATDGSPEAVADAVTKAANDQANRARAGITTAGGEGYHAAQTRMYEQAADAGGYTMKVMWVTHFRPTTCGTCAALHGEVRTLGTTFDPKAHFGPGKPPTTFGELAGPPRHPNCGCKLVPFIDGETVSQAKDAPAERVPVRTDQAGPTPKTMRRYRKSWYAVLKRKLQQVLGRRIG